MGDFGSDLNQELFARTFPLILPENTSPSTTMDPMSRQRSTFLKFKLREKKERNSSLAANFHEFSLRGLRLMTHELFHCFNDLR